MSTQSTEATPTAIKPEDRILDMNKVVFGTTGESSDLLLLSDAQKDAFAGKIAVHVKEEWDLPEKAFHVVRVMKKILDASTAEEILCLAVRGLRDSVKIGVKAISEKQAMRERLNDLDVSEMISMLLAMRSQRHRESD